MKTVLVMSALVIFASGSLSVSSASAEKKNASPKMAKTKQERNPANCTAEDRLKEETLVVHWVDNGCSSGTRLPASNPKCVKSAKADGVDISCFFILNFFSGLLSQMFRIKKIDPNGVFARELRI